MSLLVEGLGYVALGTPDLDGSVAFFRDVCQLEVSEAREGAVFLRGDERHHWVRLEPAETPGIVRVGYQVTDRASKAEIVDRLDRRGIERRDGGNVREDRVAGAVRFTAIDGIEVELYDEMVQMPVPPRPTGVNLNTMLHAVFMVDDVDATREFWRDVLDFRRSDQIEDLAVFMRCGNRYHHSVGFLRGGGAAGKLDHFCILVDHIDDVMRMQNLARQAGIPMDHELVRHAASGSIGTYLNYELLGLGVEYCVGHGQLEDDDAGRLLIASPSTVNLWNALPGPAVAGAEDANRGSRLVEDVYDLMKTN